MESINHNFYAKKAIEYLINHIINFKKGDKFVTYGEFAKAIDYPEPHIGSNFGRNIGMTLGIMGHLLDDIKIDNWIGRIPYLQALVVRKDTKLPSDGIREFQTDYPALNTEKKKDFIKLEYERIFQFGERWYSVLIDLGLDNISTENKIKIRYNPFGNEGSPEHKNLRDFISNNPNYIGLDFKSGITEYPLKSGDSIDVLFQDENRIIGVEVKSIRSGSDDLERGIFQCIKYREVLKAENYLNNKELFTDCLLVYEGEMDSTNLKTARKLNVQYFNVKFNE